ncbi:MAG: DNA-3-methyladenine glycosylase I [Saprospiraceae bacterium]|nr:DNA-3-methyladenine glycosylase I [Candidatus Vicinibacter affinis]
MDKPTSYCEAVANMEPESLHRVYHDQAYGYPIHEDDELFGRLLLEINQAGLSWTTILNKQDNFRRAYHDFNIRKVAAYQDKDINRLLEDPGIIRNKLKIAAAIHNAREIIALQKSFGSFKNWLDQHHPKSKEEWVKIFKKQFKFTGGEIVNEFLLSTGYLPGAHIKSCPTFHKIKKAGPAWMLVKGKA